MSGDPCPAVKYEWAIRRLDGLEISSFLDMGRKFQTMIRSIQLLLSVFVRDIALRFKWKKFPQTVIRQIFTYFGTWHLSGDKETTDMNIYILYQAKTLELCWSNIFYCQ